MPQAVVHVLFAIILLDLFRDYVIKNKKAIPLHYIFIGGVAGLLPDIDIPLFWLVKHILGFEVPWFHRLFTHSLFMIGLFLVLTLLVKLYCSDKKKWVLFAVITFGVSLHVLLDGLLAGTIALYYPFSSLQVGLDLLGNVAFESFMEGLDAIVLLVWLWDLDRRHRLRDYI